MCGRYLCGCIINKNDTAIALASYVGRCSDVVCSIVMKEGSLDAVNYE